MIKKIRKNYIIIAMISIFLVLLGILGIINFTNYKEINTRADRTLSIIIDNGGKFPKQIKGKDGHSELPPDMSPEAPFETRYFSVFFDSNGSVHASDTSFIAALTSEEAVEYAEQVFLSGEENGFYNDYKYLSADYQGGTLIAFLDCRRDFDRFKTFLTTSILVSLAGMSLVFILVLVLSKLAIQPIVESYEKQKRFITDVSHEIKTPLTIIDANTEVIEMKEGETKWTKSTRMQIQRLTELTNRLISLARMDEGIEQMPKSEFSISNAIIETVEPFRSVAELQSKTLEVDVEKDITYNGDEKALRQLFSILLDNAVKYSDTGGNIKVRFRKTGRRNELTVTNTAYGIMKGNYPQFFDRFYRGDSSRNSKSGGYGIGLSLAKSIVEAHKGKITARSEDGESITVTAIL